MIFVFLLVILANDIRALSYNQPKICPTGIWKSHGNYFVFQDTLVSQCSTLFVDSNNTIYYADHQKEQIIVWFKDKPQPISISYLFHSELTSLFVWNNGDIYMSDANKRIHKWIASTNIFVCIIDTKALCVGLFIDLNNNLYCSMTKENKVMKIFLNDNDGVNKTIVAGTNTFGMALNQLNGPWGIFVDANLNLYVADVRNNRIQLFHFGEMVGKTVAGETSLDITIQLYNPYSIILDSDEYLFIADTENHRIVGSGPNGFRCLVGCNRNVETLNKLSRPRTLSFDTNGNLLVADTFAQRIKKFNLQKDSCVIAPSTIGETYSSILTSNHTMYSRTLFDHSYYHYEAIGITVSKTNFYILTGNGSVHLYGHVYKDYFDRFNPTENLIAWNGNCCNKDQFKFTLELQINVKYILVVTTYHPNVTGTFLITIFGSDSIYLKSIDTEPSIESNYSFVWTDDHKSYAPFVCDDDIVRPYEAIQIDVNETGFYTVFQHRYTDRYSYMYESHFYSLIPHGNLITKKLNYFNSFSGRPLTVKLMNNIRYILVVTGTYMGQEVTVKILGKSKVNLLRTHALPAVVSHYSLQTTTQNQTYAKGCTSWLFYYETIRLTGFTNAYYSFSGAKNVRIYPYLYKNHFDPLNPSRNLISIERHLCEDPFQNADMFTVKLQANTIYILLLTTHVPAKFGYPLTIVVIGPTMGWKISNYYQFSKITS
ncbi:unnamed protein product [Adineta ricciae]|uniref:Uncharacterized protein n=1 Tax=Adineta ricciae TaxID=249248 RepID=A0A816FQ82_ADIRI|nr:unnamed protein product [Adineta ricciae]CAF1664571.1 unnamed protein product [Adineta ricciae]